jgi:hypothetical protein
MPLALRSRFERKYDNLLILKSFKTVSSAQIKVTLAASPRSTGDERGVSEVQVIVAKLRCTYYT